MKKYYITNNLGTAKYAVSYCDGVQTNRDGSPFWGIALFSNKRKMQKFENELKADGYTYRWQ